MSSFDNDLSKGEAERLAVLLEEMGESLQVIGKVLRHGYESYHPDDPTGPKNRALLVKELGDVTFAIELARAAGDVSRLEIMAAAAAKCESVTPFLHHQPKYLLARVREAFAR